MATTWTDPAGTQHTYTDPRAGLRYGVKRALERDRVWRTEGDPAFDSGKFQVTADGRIVEEDTLPWWAPVATLAAPLAAGFLPGLLGGGGAAGAGGAGTAAAAPAAAGGTLASSSLPVSALMGGPGAIASQGASGLLAGAGGAAAGGGLSGWLKGLIPSPKDALGMAGAGIGAFAHGAAKNREDEFNGGMDLERLLMDRDRETQTMRVQREQEGRAGASDAWRKLLATDYAQRPNAAPALSPYSKPRRDLSGLRPGADALQAEVMQRLTGGNPIAPIQQRPLSVDPSLLRGGGAERAANILGPILSILGRR